MRNLSDIETYIEARPDSALLAIRQIDTTILKRRSAKAKYALLHAIALDKNYIDTADIRIIQPAVEYYNRHGSPEERLKANFYQGVALYNGLLFDQAIVSLYRALEDAEIVDDCNLLGLLYSRMALTHMQTRDYSQASVFLEKAAESFRLCGQKDKEDMVLAQKTRNLVQLREWDDAEGLISKRISDTTISKTTRASIMMDYATCLLYSSDENDSLAMSLFSQAISEGGALNGPESICAYAYVLGINGNNDESESLFKRALDSPGDGDYSYYYWNHRIKIKKGDYKGGYYDLWSAMRFQDSILNNKYSVSAANSGREYLERKNLEKTIMIHNQRDIILFSALLLLVLLLIAYVLRQETRIKEREQEEKREKMEVVIESLKNQILEIKKERDNLDAKTKINTRHVKFSFLAEIYDDVYNSTRKDQDIEERLLSALKTRIGNLRFDSAAQKNFETMLNKETGGLMACFRKDILSLSEQEYKMASYYFAGFDNTTVMLILDISSLENTRVKKNRLKHKILDTSCSNKELYLSLL